MSPTPSSSPLELLVLAILAVLAALFYGMEFSSGGGFCKKLRRFLRVFSTPEIDETKITVEYDIPEASTAAAIIQSWFPHEETEFLEGAPLPMFGKISKSINYNSGIGTVSLDLYYNIPFPLDLISIPARRANASFIWRLKELKRNVQPSRDNPNGVVKSTEITYEWTGADTATNDMFSPDYQVLKYLIERTEQEFNLRNYKKITTCDSSDSAAANATLRGRQAKQWWRTYNAGEAGQRVYSFWPTPQDYLESVQNPRQNFKDAGLQSCSVVLNNLGIPRVMSGMFASVYQFSSESEQWALRCFDTRLIDQQERYKAVSSFIIGDDLPYTVDFHYLEDGIKCGDTWFPILKMVWVEGLTLEAYVRESLRKYDVLNELRWQFQTMMQRLKANGVAHGDLQHGNILVSSGEIYLVDYDGFYVPALAGKHSNELGHPNYQHPTRTEKYFGPYLDNFSAWVIDLSLLFLIEDPTLWQQFSGGDECLLLRKADFVHPEESKLIAALKKHQNPRIRSGVEKFLQILQLRIEDIPYLECDKPETIQIDAQLDRIQ